MSERVGEFELERLIATGGMAEVFLARRVGAPASAPPVVVKRMLPELAVNPAFVQMFVDEAALVGRLHHPNIVEVFELGQEGNRYFLAMELVDGPHLGQLMGRSIRAGHPLPVELCAWVVARAADGIHAAHEQTDAASGQSLQIVHRDISPQNILVARDGSVKVTDFGVAKAATQQSKTRTGVVKGKVAYMSPEQCLGEAVDRRTDVFALGVVLYELLTRQRLFRDKSDLLVMQRITMEDVPAPSIKNPELDDTIDEICARALARDRGARLKTAARLGAQLDAWVAARGVTDPRAALQRWFATHPVDLGVGASRDSDTGSDAGAGSVEEQTDATASAPSAHSLPPTVMSGPGTALTRLESQRRGQPRSGPPSPPHPDDVTRRSPVRDDDARVSGGVRGADSDALGDGSSASSRGPRFPAARQAGAAPAARPRERTMAAAALLAAATGVAIAIGLVGARGPQPPVPDGASTVGSPTPTPTPTPTAAPTQAATAGAAQGAAAQQATGRVTITSIPAGVAVLVDDTTLAGRTPVTVDHAPGAMKIQAQWPDQAPQVESVDVVAGGSHEVEFRALVALEVNSEPPRARVRMDGELLGETPLAKAAVVLPGRPVEVELQLPGFVPVVQTLVPEAGKPLVVRAQLARAAVEVKTRAPAPATYGFLNMRSTPWVEVRVKGAGENLGDTPLAQARVPSGRQTLVLKNPEQGIDGSISLVIPEEKAVTVILEWEPDPAGGWQIRSKQVR